MSLDDTDAKTITKRVKAWNAGGIMERSALLYQMGGRPGVDPYGWREPRILAAIETALRLNMIEPYYTGCGTTYRARD